MRKSISELTALARNTLPEKRFLHTLEVEKEVRYIASFICPEKEEDLAGAALLHDITKCCTLEEHIALAGEFDKNDLKAPETLHAKSGAVYAKGLSEPLWSAIESHTTGKRDMSVEEIILFLADYTEATRSHRSCKTEREILHRELEQAKSTSQAFDALNSSLCRVLDSTVSYLRDKKVFIHPRTLDALEWAQEEKNEQRK